MSDKEIRDRLARLEKAVGRIEEVTSKLDRRSRERFWEAEDHRRDDEFKRRETEANRHERDKQRQSHERKRDDRLFGLLEPLEGVGPKMLRLSTLSDLWDIPRSTLMDEVKTGRLPAKKIKNRLCVLAGDAIKWQDDHLEDRVPASHRRNGPRLLS